MWMTSITSFADPPKSLVEWSMGREQGNGRGRGSGKMLLLPQCLVDGLGINGVQWQKGARLTTLMGNIHVHV